MYVCVRCVLCRCVAEGIRNARVYAYEQSNLINHFHEACVNIVCCIFVQTMMGFLRF